MIFFCVWLRVYSREVLRELFQLPNTSIIIGILGIIVILVAGCPSIVGLLGLTSSTAQAKRNEPSPETPTIPPLPSLPCGWAFGLDLFPPTYPTQRAKPKNSSHPLRLAADLPRPSADGSRRRGSAPPAPLRFAPLRSTR